jgi:3',5'-cyclic AMP phosphodiesterase CpdA
MSRGHHILLGLFLWFGAAAGWAHAQKLERGPYLQLPTDSSMVIRWRTDKPSKGLVRWGLSPESATNRVQHAGSLTEHVVQLTRLKPNTRYFYAIGSETNQWLTPAAPEFSFITPPRPGTVQPVRIWAVGDPGTASTNQSNVRNAFYQIHRQRPADLWLMLGDNAYSSGTDAQFQRAVFDVYGAILRQTPVWPTLGNHDAMHADSPTLSGPYYDIFTLPTLGQSGGLSSGTEAYYSFDFANVHFVCLDSEDTDRSRDGAMAAWLRADLANNTRDWVIAYFHHPPYTKGSHDSDKHSDSAGRMTEMRENFLPILESGGVDLVLTGHSHSYERSYLLNGHYGLSTNLQPSMILNAGSGRLDHEGSYAKNGGNAPHQGAVYICAGSSGQISGGKLNHPVNWVSLNKLGSLLIDVDGLRADIRFIGDKGQLRDYFTIEKK